ncbi:GrlR family regulatory protein [Leminorella grimontii]|uniref:GrlR family regulatory protein n=1 Tax=Leminorella grimontii TaxID=82981 RepID=UPI0032208ABF
MKDGIYFVVFKSNNLAAGSGTVVVNGNAVNGGDFAYSYKGRANGNAVTLVVEKHNKTATSVFGDVNKFNLILTAAETPHGYLISGNMEGIPSAQIQIDAKFIGDLL